MANDLISRERLISAVWQSHDSNPHPLSRDAAMHKHEHKHFLTIIYKAPKVDAVEVVHGWWVLKAHEENANYRWNVTAECSECHHSKGEVYAGFFPGFPKDLAREVVLDSAKIVKLDNFCPNCGAKMDGDGNG